MAISGKIYPKAIPCHSPEELATQNSRLSQQNEELTAQTKRLSTSNEELTERSDRLGRWTGRLAGACMLLLSLTIGLVVVIVYFPGVVMPVPRRVAPPEFAAPANLSQDQSPKETKIPNPTPDIQAKVASLDLPVKAIAKPDAGALFATSNAGFLEALGGLSATHLYQSHLNIGLLADGVESETYTVEEADRNLKTVVDMMKLMDTQLAKVAKAGLDPEDQESIAQIQAVTALLQLQAASLRGYWATGDMQQAEDYHKARKAASQGLAKIMGTE